MANIGNQVCKALSKNPQVVTKAVAAAAPVVAEAAVVLAPVAATAAAAYGVYKLIRWVCE